MDNQSTIERDPATKTLFWFQQVEPNTKYVWLCGQCHHYWPAMNILQHPRQCPMCKVHWDEIKPQKASSAP
jgi:rubrerythrin